MELTESQVAYLDGLFEAAEDLSDGAWGAMCQDLVRGCGKFKGKDPYDVWIAWCEIKSTKP